MNKIRFVCKKHSMLYQDRDNCPRCTAEELFKEIEPLKSHDPHEIGDKVNEIIEKVNYLIKNI